MPKLKKFMKVFFITLGSVVGVPVIFLVLLIAYATYADPFFMKLQVNRAVDKCFNDLVSQFEISQQSDFGKILDELKENEDSDSKCKKLWNWHPGNLGRHTQEIDYEGNKYVFSGFIPQFTSLKFLLDDYDNYKNVKKANYIYLDGASAVTIFNYAHEVIRVYKTQRYIQNEDGSISDLKTGFVKQFADEFSDNGDGTITHSQTKLTWQRCSVGQNWTGETCEGESTRFIWVDAMGLSKDGWRLPTAEELNTLVFCSSGHRKPSALRRSGLFGENFGETLGECKGDFTRPTINRFAFPNTPESWFWSSSPSAHHAGDVMSISFSKGAVDYSSKRNLHEVRLLRDE